MRWGIGQKPPGIATYAEAHAWRLQAEAMAEQCTEQCAPRKYSLVRNPNPVDGQHPLLCRCHAPRGKGEDAVPVKDEPPKGWKYALTIMLSLLLVFLCVAVVLSRRQNG